MVPKGQVMSSRELAGLLPPTFVFQGSLVLSAGKGSVKLIPIQGPVLGPLPWVGTNIHIQILVTYSQNPTMSSGQMPWGSFGAETFQAQVHIRINWGTYLMQILGPTPYIQNQNLW